MHEAHGWRGHHAILIYHRHMHRLRVHRVAVLGVRSASRHLQQRTHGCVNEHYSLSIFL